MEVRRTSGARHPPKAINSLAILDDDANTNGA